MIGAGATMGASLATDPGADPAAVGAVWRHQRVHPKGARGSGRRALNTRTPEGRAQVDRAFDAWLPAAVACAPGIRWDMAPAAVKRYLVLWVGQGPDALVIALAMGCLCTYGGAGRAHLYSSVTAINTLLRRLRRVCGLTTLAQLGDTAVWDRLVAAAPSQGAVRADQSFPPGLARAMSDYASLTETHLAYYRQRVLTTETIRAWQATLDALHPTTQVRWTDLFLPAMPARWFEQSGIQQRVTQEAQARRKAASDVLTPLHAVLVQLAVYRHLAVKDLIERYRAEVTCIEERGLALPHTFEHTIVVPVVNREARAVSEVQITGRRVALRLSIWDRWSWAETHFDRLTTNTTRGRLRHRRVTYAPDVNGYYLQCHNPPRDLFWFGEIVAGGALARIDPTSPRREAAERLGEPAGFGTVPSGLLNPARSDTAWLHQQTRPGELLLDAEALYRGVLYGAAIAIYALTSATRATELLQLSDARWDQIEVPEMRDGTPTGRVQSTLIQWVLPKGALTDRERQPKLISPQLQPLLKEIIDLLERRHGGMIPAVLPAWNTKEDHLGREPYLLQWNASPDGAHGLLHPSDLGRLLRFLYYGVELTTATTGEPIHVGVHLCRHVLATTAHHDAGVPYDVIAFLLTHRRMMPRDQRSPVPAATLYYSKPRPQDALAFWQAYQTALAARCAHLPMVAPVARDLATMDGWLQEVWERFGLLGPTTLGWCSAGLCVRDDRRQCIGCPWLVEDYRMLGFALRWRRMILIELDRLEQAALSTDARQKRRMVDHLDGHIAMMRHQEAVVRAHGQLPRFLTVPRPTMEGKDVDAN